MKIAYDFQIFSLHAYGGISRYIYELAKEIAITCDQDVRIVAPLYINQYLRQSPETLKITGIPIPRVPKIGRIVSYIDNFLSGPVVRCFHPQIVHETYYSSRSIAPKYAKVILTVHDMIHEKFDAHGSMMDTTRRDKSMAVKRADHVICVSEHTRQDLIELLDVDPAKTSVVYHGFTMGNQSKTIKRTIKHDRPFIFYVGSRGSYKNFDGLLQAYASSPMLRNDFDLICFGGGKFTAAERNRFHRLGLGMDTIHHAHGSDLILADFYSGAKAFIYPSLYEGFGFPPLEAMNFDCPVVCSKTSSIPEVVGDAGEYFDPYDIDSIRTAIERVVSNDALRNDLIVKGKARLSVFSWQRCARETLDVYRNEVEGLR